MNTINIIKSDLNNESGFNYMVSVVNGKFENHVDDSQYAKCTINERTYSYIQSLRISLNDSLYIYDAYDLKKWGPAMCKEIKGKHAKEHKERLGLKGKRGIKVFHFFGWAAC